MEEFIHTDLVNQTCVQSFQMQSGHTNLYQMFNGLNHSQLEEQINRLEQEARMVLPGIQAIFGFQLIAVFNNRFDSLSSGQQYLHFTAVVMIAVSVCLIMTPAAWHRHAEEKAMTEKFLRLSSRF